MKSVEKIVEEVFGDQVKEPAHYQSESGLQCIEVIAAMGHMESFCIGNAVKYLWRAGKKSRDTYIQDLKKARQYIDMLIAHLEKKL